MENRIYGLNITDQVKLNTKAIDKIELVIYGDEKEDGMKLEFKNVFIDYKTNKKILKILTTIISITFSLFVALTIFTITYNLNLFKSINRVEVLIDQHLKEP